MVSRALAYFVSVALSVVWVAPVALAASGAVIAVSRRHGTDHSVIVDRLVTVWLVAALVAVALLTLQPRGGGFAPPRDSVLNPLRRPSRQDAFWNVAMFIPVGFFAALRWRSKARPVVWVTGFSFLASATIELIQRVAPIHRAASVHDVLFNTIGGFVGAVIALVVVALVRRSGSRLFSEPIDA